MTANAVAPTDHAEGLATQSERWHMLKNMDDELSHLIAEAHKDGYSMLENLLSVAREDVRDNMAGIIK